MTPERWITWAIAIGSLVVTIYGYYTKRRERSRLRDKIEEWNEYTKAIVNHVTEIKNDIDSNRIKEAKELRYGISGIGHNAEAIHQGLERELKKGTKQRQSQSPKPNP